MTSPIFSVRGGVQRAGRLAFQDAEALDPVVVTVPRRLAGAGREAAVEPDRSGVFSRISTTVPRGS
jgi:hypothetical protein